MAGFISCSLFASCLLINFMEHRTSTNPCLGHSGCLACWLLAGPMCVTILCLWRGIGAMGWIATANSSSNAARRYDDGCHVSRPLCFGMLFRGSGCRCGYCRFARSVDTCRRPVMLLLSHSELHADDLAWWHSSLSPRVIT